MFFFVYDKMCIKLIIFKYSLHFCLGHKGEPGKEGLSGSTGLPGPPGEL